MTGCLDHLKFVKDAKALRTVSTIQGQIVQKLVNVNPGLNVNYSIFFSYLKMLFTSNVWWSGLLKLLRTFVSQWHDMLCHSKKGANEHL